MDNAVLNHSPGDSPNDKLWYLRLPYLAKNNLISVAAKLNRLAIVMTIAISIMKLSFEIIPCKSPNYKLVIVGNLPAYVLPAIFFSRL